MYLTAHSLYFEHKILWQILYSMIHALSQVVTSRGVLHRCQHALLGYCSLKTRSSTVQRSFAAMSDDTLSHSEVLLATSMKL